MRTLKCTSLAAESTLERRRNVFDVGKRKNISQRRGKRRYDGGMGEDSLSVDDVLLESRSGSLLVVGDNEVDISGFAPSSVHSESVLGRTEKLGLLLSVDTSGVQNEKNLGK